MTAKWYLMFSGSAEEGEEGLQYVGRTTDRHVAEDHLYNIIDNSHSCFGKVIVVDDIKERQCYHPREIWD